MSPSMDTEEPVSTFLSTSSQIELRETERSVISGFSHTSSIYFWQHTDSFKKTTWNDRCAVMSLSLSF